MKPAAPLISLALLSVPATAVLAQTPSPSATITVTRRADGTGSTTGWDINLPPDMEKTATDQITLVIDGKNYGLGGFYIPGLTALPLHYVASASSDLDGQVKDILKAQGIPIKVNTITYRITAGIIVPVIGGSGTPATVPATAEDSETLRFRHGCNMFAYVQLPSKATYKAGDKITLFDAVALDSSITMQQALGPHNDIFSGKFVPLPNDLLHRITIQVQFVPKTP